MSVTHDRVFCDMFPPNSWGLEIVLCSQPKLTQLEGRNAETPVKTGQERKALNTCPSRDTDRGRHSSELLCRQPLLWPLGLKRPLCHRKERGWSSVLSVPLRNLQCLPGLLYPFMSPEDAFEGHFEVQSPTTGPLQVIPGPNSLQTESLGTVANTWLGVRGREEKKNY